MAQRKDWPNHDWYGRADDASEFSWGRGLVPPGKETEPPNRGGVYRAMCPPVELTPAETSASEQDSQTQARRPAAWLPRRPGSVVGAHSYRGQPRAGV